MIQANLFIQFIGLLFEIGGTFIFANSVFLSDEDIKELSFHEIGGYDPYIQKQLKGNRKTGRIGLSILLIGLGLQGIGLFL